MKLRMTKQKCSKHVLYRNWPNDGRTNNEMSFCEHSHCDMVKDDWQSLWIQLCVNLSQHEFVCICVCFFVWEFLAGTSYFELKNRSKAAAA